MTGATNQNQQQNGLNFIISAPRSGSTWLTQALNLHPQIFATENRLFGDFFDVWPNALQSNGPRITFDTYARGMGVHFFFDQMGMKRAEFIDKFQKAYHAFLIRFMRRHSGKEVLVDKVTPYLDTADVVVSSIANFFPQARVVNLIRDGRDVLTSGRFDWLNRSGQGSKPYRYFVDGDDSVHIDRFFDDESVEEWARSWMQPILAVQSEIGSNRSGLNFLTVRYEDMSVDLPNELCRIFQHLDVSAEPTIANQAASETNFEKQTGRKPGDALPTAKARSGIVGDWANYFTRADGELFHSIAGDLLIDLHYEKDHRWVQNLPDSLDLVGRA